MQNIAASSALALAILALSVPSAASAANSETDPATTQDACHSHHVNGPNNDIPNTCPCIIERAGAAGFSDDQLLEFFAGPLNRFDPPPDMNRVTFNRLRRIERACVLDVRYAQLSDAKDNPEPSSNPQPDGSYTARPIQPHPEGIGQNSGPCHTQSGPLGSLLTYFS
ncbi:hypothetical protein [Erythrobacter sp. Alg231-14]|uniref:hypothetical protein n=1 Tax=Erythrobacter sp. Alg231-14 TaxID=1922225 RepID=UPI00307B9598